MLDLERASLRRWDVKREFELPNRGFPPAPYAPAYGGLGRETGSVMGLRRRTNVKRGDAETERPWPYPASTPFDAPLTGTKTADNTSVSALQ